MDTKSSVGYVLTEYQRTAAERVAYLEEQVRIGSPGSHPTGTRPIDRAAWEQLNHNTAELPLARAKLEVADAAMVEFRQLAEAAGLDLEEAASESEVTA